MTWPPAHRPASALATLTGTLAWSLGATPVTRGHVDFEGLDVLTDDDLSIAPPILSELVGVARSGSTISKEDAREVLSRTGMPTLDAFVLGLGSVSGVVAEELRSARRVRLADELARTSSSLHRRQLLERLNDLEAES